MCQFISFLHRPDNGDIAVYDLTSHSNTQEKLKLFEPLWCAGHYLPDGEIECRVTDKNRVTREECEERLRNRFSTFYDFLDWCLIKEIGGGLDLRGCDLSKVKALTLPEKVELLDLSGCDLSKVKTWPKEIERWLYLRNCDLGKIKSWPEKISGGLDLRGCDLSKVKALTLPEKVELLDLSGCDLSKIKTWPEEVKLLDLSGCDLGKVKTWPEEVFSLYLSGCDLSKIKTWPEKVEILHLNGCDLSKVEIPKKYKDKIIK